MIQFAIVFIAALLTLPSTSLAAPAAGCAADAVAVGPNCIDRYEATVWRVPDAVGSNARLVRKIREGTVTQADLSGGGAVQLGAALSDDYAPCSDSGQNCANDIYAVSLKGVLPSTFATWFQAQEACTNSGKRLPTNAEWQAAANGTPDPGPDNGTTDCNTMAAGSTLATGARSSCVSARGAYDMVGNLFEYVAEWVPHGQTCVGWGAVSNDAQCAVSVGENQIEGVAALLRGGNAGIGELAGPLTANAIEAQVGNAEVGFRCVR